jgi:hypothetical protein
MTPAQQLKKRRTTKIRMLRLKTAQASASADQAQVAARTAKVEFKRARKAHKAARKAVKAARKRLEALQRKLAKLSPPKSGATRTIHRAPAAASTLVSDQSAG